MKNYLIFAILLSGISCMTQNRLERKYSDVNSENTFSFFADSIFEYKYSFAHNNEYSKGKFSNNGSSIILSSDIQNRISNPFVRESKNDKEMLSIYLSGGLPQSAYKCEIFINDTLYKVSNQNELISTGLTHVQAEKEINLTDLFFRYCNAELLANLQCASVIKSVTLKIIRGTSPTSTAIYPYAIYTDKYLVKENRLNKIEMHIPLNDSLFNYKIFTKELIKVQKNTISVYNSYENKWVSIPKKSLRM